MHTSEFPCEAAHLHSGTDALAKIDSAIKALPLAGGCVDARGLTGTQHGTSTVVVDRPVTLVLGAVQILVTANPAFLVQGNGNAPPKPLATLTVFGLDPNATVIAANRDKVTLFELTGNIVPLGDYYGGETLTIKRCGLCGGNVGGNGGFAGTVMVNTQGYPTTNFQNGLLLIEDNLITNFGDTALKIGQSVYFNRIHRNEFLCNKQAIYLDNNTEASINENMFLQGPNAGPTVTSIGPMHRIAHNYFYRNSLSDPSNAPDILLQPEASWPSQAGGYVWIEDNRFGSELENLDPGRRRIKLTASDTMLIAGPAIVRGNQFLGPAVPCTISVASGSATATVSLTEGYVTNGLATGIRVTIYNASKTLLNGTFAIARVDSSTNQFTYALPSSTSAESVSAAVRLADASAIELDNPHLTWDVSGNFFVNYTVLIDDNQNPPDQTQNPAFGWGESLFIDNRVICPNGGYKVFANGGNDFTWIRPPANSALKAVEPWPKQAETLTLRNRVPQSERLDVWSTNNGLTVSPSVPGEPDPFGTNRAFLLTLNGATGNQNAVSPAIDVSGLTSDSRLVIKFWAKQSTLSSLLVGLLTNGVSWYGNLFTASLGPSWKQYKFVTNQLNSLVDTFSLVFYPGDLSFTSGSVFLFAPQVSDDDNDYYPTGATSVLDTSAGARFEKSVILTSVKTMTGNATATPFVATSAGSLGNGTATVQAGSTDFSGVVQLSPGSGAAVSGTVTLTYTVPYNGVNFPVVVATLQDGSSAWTAGTSQVRVTSSSGSSCILEWVNGSPLTAGATYAIAYVVIGRS